MSAAETEPALHWSSHALNRVLEASSNLNLSPLEAYELLSTTFHSPEDHVMRNELVAAIHKTGVPLIYAESLLEDVVGIRG